MFFLITVGLTGGFMSGREHMALALSIISTPFMTIIPMLVWIYYGIKIYTFNQQISRARETRFIHDLSLLPIPTQLVVALTVALAQFMPAIAYGNFLIIMAIENKVFASALSMTASLLVILGCLTFFLYNSIQVLHHEQKTSFVKRWIDERFQKPFVQFFVEWIVRQQPGMVVISKIFSCVLILGVCQLYKFDAYDYRLLAMGSLLAFGSSLALVYQFVLFENHTFSFLRNLPLPLFQRMFHFIAAVTILNLPELMLLTRSFPDQLSLSRLPELLLFILSLLMLSYSLLLKRNIRFESFSGIIFISVMVLFLLVLSGVPLLLLAIPALIMSYYQYSKNFYGFEVSPEILPEE